MLQYAKGDLIKNVTRGVILHQVNCFGVMGAGFALQLKNTYTRNYDVYHSHSNRADLKPEDLLGTSLCTSFNNHDQLIIINAFGQLGTGGRKATSYDALDKIFYDLYSTDYNRMVYANIHMPMIGAGLGGGNWGVIETIIESHRPEDCDVTVWVL